MKTIKQTFNLILTVALWLVAMQTAFAQKMVVKTMDDKVVKYDVTNIKEVTFEEDEPFTGPEYVDLGLPSGTLWATCNVGANSPEEYGDYFAWGETEPKDEYSWATYEWCNGSYDSMTKYCTDGSYGTVDGISQLLPEDDAATANWGDEWQTPSYDQIVELYNSNYTRTEWTQVNGVYGRLVTSLSNGNSIFLPAAGYRNGTILYSAGSGGYCWTSSLNTDGNNNAYNMYFNADAIVWSYGPRYYGRTVRPVRVKEVEDDGRKYVEIGGLKWATMNVGATTVAGSYETCVGDYFAWGETEPRYSAINWTSETTAEFTWKPGQEKGYTSENPISYTGSSLDEEHDAAVANWGEGWRTPSKNDYLALFKACTGSEDKTQTSVVLTNPITEGGIYWLTEEQQIETAYTGVCGTLFVSKDDISKRVFFPSANYADKGLNIFYDIRRKIYRGFYITIDEYMGMAAKAHFKETEIKIDGALKTTGWPVRAVKETEPIPLAQGCL